MRCKTGFPWNREGKEDTIKKEIEKQQKTGWIRRNW